MTSKVIEGNKISITLRGSNFSWDKVWPKRSLKVEELWNIITYKGHMKVAVHYLWILLHNEEVLFLSEKIWPQRSLKVTRFVLHYEEVIFH